MLYLILIILYQKRFVDRSWGHQKKKQLSTEVSRHQKKKQLSTEVSRHQKKE